MSKPKPFIVQKTPSPAPVAAKPFLAQHLPNAASIRETIESIAIAFILAFLFRTFEAEAFVIPTGSMAPTLMGRHKDLKCEICGYPYQVNASDEVDREGRPQSDPIDQAGRPIRLKRSCTCPMCRYTMEINGDNPQPSYSGDRIIVNKFSYQFNDPKRWNVIVFYFPKGAHDNYIKRLAGLPNETLRIQFGDLWIRNNTDKSGGNEGEGEFKIARKPPDVLLAMLQPVFDNDYMPAIAKLGWPVRWQADSASSNTAGTWTSDDDINYQTDGTAAGEVWLRYHHRAPSVSQRDPVLFPQKQVKPQLITDFTAYNTGRIYPEQESRFDLYPDILGLHWVGDLALMATVELQSNTGQVVLELIKGGRRFQCRLDAATGEASLSISGEDMNSFHRTAQTNFRDLGKHRLIFSNCDRELLLWIDDSVVKFDLPATYDDLHDTSPTPSDLAPVGVASRGVKIKLSNLKVLRDIYYIAVNRTNSLNDYKNYPALLKQGQVEQFFSDPQQWKNDLEESNLNEVEFTLQANQYFALGDNSAKSHDSRFWGSIERDLLKGKALFIYWPHSWHRIPYVNVPFPYFPNFARMHFIK